MARGVGFIARQGVKKDVAALQRLVQAEGFEVIALVVGLPLGEDGEEQRSTRLARQVAEAARDTLGYPLHYQDETYSTLEAEERLREQRVPGFQWAELVDAEAAAVILEDWLHQQSAASE